MKNQVNEETNAKIEADQAKKEAEEIVKQNLSE